MSRAVYSALLAERNEVSDPVLLLSVPETETWILRTITATFGSFAGYVGAGISLANTDPWLYLCTSGVGNFFSDHPVTFGWEGRIVMPSGTDWYARALDGDTCDMLASGYRLTN